MDGYALVISFDLYYDYLHRNLRKEGAADMKKKVRLLLIVLFAVLFLFSAWQLWGILRNYQESQSSYNALEQYVSFGNTEVPEAGSESTDDAEPVISEPMELPDISAWPQVDFDELAKINPEIVGWIYIEGTDINYPVVQGTDNDYYLKHLFDGTYNSSGCIFLDYRCAADFSDRHSIIYGHHMNNKTMFGGLMSYKDQAFYEEHSTALLVTPTAYYRIQFFSGYVSDNWSNAWDLALDDAGHTAWLSEIQAKSCFETEYAPVPEDRIITLSTCTYEFDSAKFVLHGYINEAIDKAIFE